MDQLVQLAVQVFLVQGDFVVRLELLEALANQAFQVQLDRWVHKDREAFQGTLVLLDLLDLLDYRGVRDKLETEDDKVCLCSFN